MDYKTCQLDFDENDYDAMGCTDASARNIEKKCYNLMITMCKHKGIQDISWTNPEVISLYKKIINKKDNKLREKFSTTRITISKTS